VPNSVSYKRNNQSQRKVGLVLPICLFTICILGLANLGLSNLLSTKGIEFGQVSTKLTQVKNENRRLSLNLSQLTRLSLIKQKAKTAGFININSTLTIQSAPSTLAHKM